MKMFNKKGDEGETSLLFGCRISKDSMRCEAYGTLDEVVSCLGMARNFVTRVKTKSIILKIQKEIFTVGAELAVEHEDYEQFVRRFAPVTEEAVARLEVMINELESEITIPDSFIIPGGSSGSAMLDMARALVRRAERRTVTLKRNKEINNDAILHYLNRLADLLFSLSWY